MRVHAVVVNWNGGAANRACLESLESAGLERDAIVFVDNGSSDGSLEEVARFFSGIQLLKNAENIGYGDGCNQGVQLALERGADAVLLVNNDLQLSSDCLSGLVERMGEDPGLGVIGPRVLYLQRPEQVWAAGGELTYRQNLSTLLGHKRPDGPRWQVERRVDYVPGCAMLVRRAVFEQVGLLDGRYFAYHEDVDFCLRARQAGFGVWCAGQLAALHDAHSSTGGGYNPRRKYMMGVNTIWFLRRHGTPSRWLRCVLFDVLPLPVVVLFEAFRGRARGALAKALGTWHGLCGRRVTAEVLRPGNGPLW